MAVVKELLRSEKDGSLSFGNYELKEKTKLKDFEHQGDVYYVKTFGEITKLEKNGSFLYESEPGTAVTNFAESDEGVSFTVDGKEVTMQVKVGDKVIYSKYAGNEVKLGEEEYIIVKQSDILAIVE